MCPQTAGFHSKCKTLKEGGNETARVRNDRRKIRKQRVVKHEGRDKNKTAWYEKREKRGKKSRCKKERRNEYEIACERNVVEDKKNKETSC